MNLVPGSYLSPYRIVEQIGFGRMATEYKAQKAGVSSFVAIKVIPAYFAEDRGMPERKQDAMLLTKLDNPGMLKVLDYGEGHGTAYLVTEYVDATPLSDQVGTPMSVADTVRILMPVAGALDYLHARAIVHRDVKPANILLVRDGRSLLADVGISKIVDSALRVSETGEVIGTPAYMTPEQAVKDPVSRMTDQYALATVAYEMITGQKPYIADTPQKVMMAHAQLPPAQAKQANPTVRTAIDKVLQRGMAKRPGDRYTSCTEFVAALRDETDEVVPQAKPTTAVPIFTPPPVPTLSVKPAGSPWIVIAAAIGGALLLAIVALAAVIIITGRQQQVASAATPTPDRVTQALTAVPSIIAGPLATATPPTPRSTPVPPTAVPTKVPPTTVPVAAQPTQGPCQFLFGFKVLHDRIPEKVGECADNETHNPANGDAIQHTSTKGLLVWRKADNWTAFTDGANTWINGPGGNLYQRPNDKRFSWEPNPDNLPVIP